MSSCLTSKNTTTRLLFVFVTVLILLPVGQLAWDSSALIAFRRVGPRTWHLGWEVPSLFSRPSTDSDCRIAASLHSYSSSGKAADVWLRHPSVLTLQQLGLWQTSFLGIIPPDDAAVVSSGSSSSNSSDAELNRTATAADVVLLRHWWRCQQNGDGTLDLRGLGSVYPAVDATYLYQVMPDNMTDEYASLNMTDTATGKQHKLQMSPVSKGGVNAIHVEGHGLDASSTYRITPTANVSKHSFSWDSSRCSKTPDVFRPGSLWTVVNQAKPYETELFAKLLVEHARYHQAVGFSGSLLVLTRAMAVQLVMQPAVQKSLNSGSIVIIIWDEDVVPSMPYYHQYLWYNLVMMATWGVKDVKLAMIDADEFLVAPSDLTFTAAFRPGGCLHGYQQARIARYNAYPGWTPADAEICYKDWLRRTQPAATQVAVAAAAKESANGNAALMTGTIMERGLGRRAHAARSSNQAPLARCISLRRESKPVIEGLTSMGWQQFFKQLQQPVQQQQQQQGKLPEQLQPSGYIEQLEVNWPYPRWTHKSISDPNYVAAYAVHEAQVVMPGGRDSLKPVSRSCAFTIHFVNMYHHRNFGTGVQMHLTSSKLFNMSQYINKISE